MNKTEDKYVSPHMARLIFGGLVCVLVIVGVFSLVSFAVWMNFSPTFNSIVEFTIMIIGTLMIMYSIGYLVERYL